MFSAMNIARTCVVPLYPVLISHLSNRTIALSGGVTLAIGMLWFTLAPGVSAFVIGFGLLLGTSFTLIKYSSIGMLGYYFEDKLGIANGLAFTSSGCSKLILPMFFEYLLTSYGLFGAMMIMGATACHQLIGASLLRPISFYENVTIRIARGKTMDMKIGKRRAISLSRQERTIQTTKIQFTDGGFQPTKFTNDRVKCKDVSHFKAQQSNKQTIFVVDSSRFTPPLNQGQLANEALPELGTTEPSSGTDSVAPTLETGKHLQHGSTKDTPNVTRLRGWFRDLLVLWSSAKFRMMCGGHFCSLTAVILLTLFIPSYLTSTGLNSSEAASVLTIIGAVELVCQLGHGWIASRKCINTAVYSGLCVILGSIGICLVALVPGFMSAKVTIPLIMLFYTSIYSLSHVLVMECVGAALYPSATIFTEVPAMAVSIFLPVVFGYIYDVWRNYMMQMMVVSCLGIAGGIFKLMSILFSNNK